ncbi:DNA replication/repair protein RecF [Wolbachia endosymbiont of Brugia malayi]|uniref:DNA replication/repair protein RecF n=1 Tax=Wolbachia endosymbiont of Brugia malayi TaxID=80849 RepID=UPI00004C928E|nr:DNA replication/repair protein RecF [Wolbachia endosymbiont of Brugia malayi]AAW70717.1 Recombinational DNA repair ATPase, RecF [Wolbachia endosymbiont strain TRS of Brugia malayi]QCB61694.1 DNA replication/repair protein RecF [Wolbachia endosymbiont of Brugia malayi]
MAAHCYIKKLKLSNFRNHLNFELDSDDSSVVIIGKNGIGKTNILEAISLLAKSNGMKKAKASEMQNRFSNKDWAVHYDFFNGADLNSIGIAKSFNKKLIQIGGKMQSSYSSLYRISNVIWLIPQMDYILLNSPSDRLKFLDRIVSLFEENYACYYMRYRKAKRERGRLLRENILNKSWLSSLENIMAVNAVNILDMRLSVLKMLQDTINSYSTQFFPKVSLKFNSQLTLSDTAKYFQNRLRENREKDSLTGRITFCVNNDKFQVFCQRRDLPINLCSTGEQKLLLLSIILSSVKARCIHYNKAPLLLLDDIMSHLDKYYRKVLIEEMLSIRCQAWITDVDQNNFGNYIDYFKTIEL